MTTVYHLVSPKDIKTDLTDKPVTFDHKPEIGEVIYINTQVYGGFFKKYEIVQISHRIYKMGYEFRRVNLLEIVECKD